MRRAGWVLPIAAALLVISASVATAESSLPWIGKSAPASGPARLAALSPQSGPAKLSKEANGFRVDFQKADNVAGGELIVYYQVAVADPRGFGDMLGIPRVVNRDGSLTLPTEYGTVGATSAFEGGIRGLPAGSSGAIFDRSKILAGAFIRFGPFYRSADSGVTVTTTGAALRTGDSVQIGGEPFAVSAIQNKDGTTTIEFVNLAANATVVATHPGSTVTVAIDGKPVEVVRVSTNFAKTAGYEVNANRSSVTIGSPIPDGSEVTIVSSSVGSVYRGNWDFPIN